MPSLHCSAALARSEGARHGHLTYVLTQRYQARDINVRKRVYDVTTYVTGDSYSLNPASSPYPPN